MSIDIAGIKIAEREKYEKAGPLASISFDINKEIGQSSWNSCSVRNTENLHDDLWESKKE